MRIAGKRLTSVASCASALLLVTAARAEEFSVTIIGDVGFNVIAGDMAPVPDGAPVSLSFNVDSNVFLNSGSFPTRGYAIDPSSFSMNVGGVPVPLVTPQPGGDTPYFVLRDNDPAVDGFFISRGGVDLPAPLVVTIPGVAPTHDLEFSVGYANGTQISSLNITDAVGTYGTANLGSFGWTIGRFGNAGAEYNFESLTIAVVPEPTALAVAGLASVSLRRRR